MSAVSILIFISPYIAPKFFSMSRNVTILGAGLVGSLLSVILRKQGYAVDLYERRPDMRAAHMSAGKSINLATSARGWKALELAGLKDEIMDLAIPMYGRQLHFQDGSTAFQPYSKNNEAIYSVSRGELNKRLMTLAEKHGVKLHFEHKCTHVDVANNVADFQRADKSATSVKSDLMFGADGAFSALRESYTHMSRVNCDQVYLDYGYKELAILPGKNGEWMMEKNALHIWPRGNYMLIALPNTDKTFTCTLFMPFEGPVSFANLKTEADVTKFFDEQFADAKALMPELLHDFFNNPTSALVTMRVSKWHHEDKNALIGDAAHAIVPFYGQGMNAGFEDCSVLLSLMEAHGDDWKTILEHYEVKRKPNGNAVGQLALLNFVEMRDKVGDPMFLERKKVEKELGKLFPEQFVSVYEMVSFSHIPYDTAISCIENQDALLAQIMSRGNFFDNITTDGFTAELENWVSDYHAAVSRLDFGTGATI